jgi:hypothetical protein
MKLTSKEVSGLLDAWCALNALGIFLDPNKPEKFFPKGRLESAKELALEALEPIKKIVQRKDFQKYCPKKK